MAARTIAQSARQRLRASGSARAAARAYTSTTAARQPVPPLPEVETFSEASRPREYYARPQRELPPLQRKWPGILVASILGVSAWGAFYLYAANQERLSSSVVKQIMNTVGDSEELRQELGEAIRFEPVWWLNGDPYIKGGVHMLQGNVDLSFRVKGHKGAGTLYFTSIRKTKGEAFTILRFRVICDNGKIIEVPVGSVKS
ncbi:cytochrome c oxidase assembly factor 1 family protein [Phanerochaete sordida]|uniref:Cytochrome c oxidase assembly factor 1 family protein n=1 Tax=Phanerochaete sordida TaxID=48140 RepID=A0A9P3G3P2_9APHY|nr:cytochrome c oxidase assembly factor 1 family protein [Phanerochaete sordida]